MKYKTTQRKFILELLQKNNNHLTAKEIHTILTPKLPQIGLSTIHRNLRLMEKEKLIKVIKFSRHEMRFDGNLKPHLHIICPNCGTAKDVLDDDNNLCKQIAALVVETKYSTFEFVFINKCENCQQNNK